jgi:GNAT superfamily N-acetyltransferase
MLFPPGIINSKLPEKNKYTNFKDIITYNFNKLTDYQLQKFMNLIKVNYLQNKDNIFIPNKENIIPYFNCNDEVCYISFYNKNITLIDKKNNIINEEKIIGCMTSRPINIFINKKYIINENSILNNKNTFSKSLFPSKIEYPVFKAYYVDYLCVDKKYRKQGIAPQLIQTHHYNQSHLNKNISISIFKREDNLNGIVPLCVYDTYGFSVEKWNKPNDLECIYKILEINAQNFRFCYDFIEKNKYNFDIVINSCITNILELLKSKNIYIYSILYEDNIICCYFFRKTCIQIEKGLEVLTCFASINNYEEKIFIQGFKNIFWKIAYNNNFGYCAIENLSHNNIIINNIIIKTKPSIISPTAYYFYNFAYPTFKSNKTLIIN